MVTTVVRLMRFHATAYFFEAIATDSSAEVPLQSSVNVSVSVTDENDNAPVFYGHVRTEATPSNAESGPLRGVNPLPEKLPIYEMKISESENHRNFGLLRVYANDSDKSTQNSDIR